MYDLMAYFDTKARNVRRLRGGIYFTNSCKHTRRWENYDFVALYDQWRNGHLRLRCHSIANSLVITLTVMCRYT